MFIIRAYLNKNEGVKKWLNTCIYEGKYIEYEVISNMYIQGFILWQIQLKPESAQDKTTPKGLTTLVFEQCSERH